jgi:undecaprenyl-diphosphatase
VTLGSSLWFAALSYAVFSGEGLPALDDRLALWLHAQSTRGGTTLWEVVTAAGSTRVIWMLGVAVGLPLLLRRRYEWFAGWAAALIGGALLTRLLKQLFHRPRPFFAGSVIGDGSRSFPSGHAMESLIAYGMLVYLAWLLVSVRPARAAVMVGVAGLVAAVGFSRLYLGVHYLTDVLGGYAAGAAWLAACILATEAARRRRDVAIPNAL